MKETTIEGVEELRRTLAALPDDLARNALAGTARAGAQALQRAAYAQLALAMQSRSPREDDVVMRKRRSPKGEVVAIYDVGPPKRKPQLRWLSDGTKPHRIEVTEAHLLSGGGTAFGTYVEHPGQLPTYWLRLAVHLSRDAQWRAMAEAMRKGLKRSAKRLNSSKYMGRQLRRIFS